jgi:orotidine-5'-phosphate decarboxylase
VENARQRLIVALDVPSASQAREMVNTIGDSAGSFKVGLQLFSAEGPTLVRELTASKRRVFLDLKLHDIPNTGASAVKSVGALGASMLTIHASGGPAMLKAAVEAADSLAEPPLLLGVTVLTSMDEEEMHSSGVPGSVADQVRRLAMLARECGLGGIVASAKEASLLRQVVGEEMAIVVPGIRPTGADKGDQARVATPAEALRAGASHLVVGRPITAAADPKRAAEDVVHEMGAVGGDLR